MPTHTDDLGIKEFNWSAHQDIQHEMCTKMNGLFTFVIKINSGNITDFVVLDSLSATTLLHEPSFNSTT